RLSACHHLAGHLGPPEDKVIGNLEIYRDHLHSDQLRRAPNGRQARWDACGLPTKDHLQRLLLLRVCPAIQKETSPETGGLPGPDVALEGGYQDKLEVCQGHIAEMSLADAVRQHPVANVVCRRLSEYAWAGDVAATDVEPVPSYMPLWDF